MTTVLFKPQQRLSGQVPKDQFAKKNVAYIVVDRDQDWVILCQSLPLLTRWINKNLSSGEKWDKVSTTGLFENLNRSGGRNGGWHKGRFRISSVPLDKSRDEFERMRKGRAKAAIVGHNMRSQSSDKSE
eukprot:3744152-Prymnesium_polylepis.2